MGSNENKHGDKKKRMSNWTEKGEKGDKYPRKLLDKASIQDSEESNLVRTPAELGYIELQEDMYIFGDVIDFSYVGSYKKYKKNKKKYCRGKEGVEHKFEVVDRRTYTEEICSNCGRVGKIFFKENFWGGKWLKDL